MNKFKLVSASFLVCASLALSSYTSTNDLAARDGKSGRRNTTSRGHENKTSSTNYSSYGTYENRTVTNSVVTTPSNVTSNNVITTPSNVTTSLDVNNRATPVTSANVLPPSNDTTQSVTPSYESSNVILGSYGSSYSSPYSDSSSKTKDVTTPPTDGNRYSNSNGKHQAETHPGMSKNGGYQYGYGYQSGQTCPSADMTLFESADEKDAYSSYGFTRGDIYYIYRYKFDPAAMTTVDGKVEKVIRVQYPDGDCYLVVILSTPEGYILVNLAPVNYFDDKLFILDEGDMIQLKGSKIRLNGRYVLIATEINKDSKVIPLRSDVGQPSWKMTGTTPPRAPNGQSGQSQYQFGPNGQTRPMMTPPSTHY